MNREVFLNLVASVRPKKVGGSRRTPHKPLVLLFALGQVAPHRQRLVLYSDLEEHVNALLEAYGTPSNKKTAVYPFRWLLTTHGLWEIPDFKNLRLNRSGDLSVTELRRRRVMGGFTQEVYDLLKDHPTVVSQAAYQILSENFPPSLHHDIMEAVGLTPGSPVWEAKDVMPRRGKRVREYLPRDPRFRRVVLEAYDQRCAVCGHDIRFDSRPLGLEAAHIKWHSHEGRDVVRNGLALCSLHHKALDYGALGLESRSGGYQILVSSRIEGNSPSTKQLLDLGKRKRLLRPPQSSSDSPHPQYVAWHKSEVFHH